MGKRRAHLVLEPIGERLPGREWVTSGIIPHDAGNIGLIQRGYEWQGDGVEDILAEWGVPVDLWCFFQSTYVYQAAWFPTYTGSGSLFVELLNGGIFRYDNIPRDTWRDYISSPSHGQAQHYTVEEVVYVMLQAPYKKVTEEMKQTNYERTA